RAARRPRRAARRAGRRPARAGDAARAALRPRCALLRAVCRGGGSSRPRPWAERSSAQRRPNPRLTFASRGAHRARLDCVAWPACEPAQRSSKEHVMRKLQRTTIAGAAALALTGLGAAAQAFSWPLWLHRDQPVTRVAAAETHATEHAP